MSTAKELVSKLVLEDEVWDSSGYSTTLRVVLNAWIKADLASIKLQRATIIGYCFDRKGAERIQSAFGLQNVKIEDWPGEPPSVKVIIPLKSFID